MMKIHFKQKKNKVMKRKKIFTTIMRRTKKKMSKIPINMEMKTMKIVND